MPCQNLWNRLGFLSFIPFLKAQYCALDTYFHIYHHNQIFTIPSSSHRRTCLSHRLVFFCGVPTTIDKVMLRNIDSPTVDLSNNSYIKVFLTGEMIITNDKYQMSEINSSAYSVQMRLIIRNIQRSDLGGYKCISKNSIGDAEGNIRLYGKLTQRYGLRDTEHTAQ